MTVILKREVKRIKNGWSSRSPVLHLTAHGHSEQVADINLQRTVRLFLTPFERDGELANQWDRLALRYVEDGKGIEVVLED